MFLLSSIVVFLAMLLNFASNEKITDTDKDFKTLQDFSHYIRARAPQPPRTKTKFRVRPVRTTTEKPPSPEDAKKFKTKIKSLLDMEYEALELEIKYFLTYLKDLIKAKQKESTELETQEKSMPKTFYDYVHNPPDSVYIFIAVCIIVVFLLCIGIYILYLVWRYCRGKSRARDAEYGAAKDGHLKSKVEDKFSGFKNKLSSVFQKKRKEENTANRGGKPKRKDTLEDVILRTTGYESDSDHELEDRDLRTKLLRMGECTNTDPRFARDRYR